MQMFFSFFFSFSFIYELVVLVTENVQTNQTLDILSWNYWILDFWIYELG